MLVSVAAIMSVTIRTIDTVVSFYCVLLPLPSFFLFPSYSLVSFVFPLRAFCVSLFFFPSFLLFFLFRLLCVCVLLFSSFFFPLLYSFLILCFSFSFSIFSPLSYSWQLFFLSFLFLTFHFHSQLPLISLSYFCFSTPSLSLSSTFFDTHPQRYEPDQSLSLNNIKG